MNARICGRSSCLLFIYLVLFYSCASPIVSSPLDLEDVVPSAWSVTKGSLSISSYHYKLGKQCLQWDWVAGDVLVINKPNVSAEDVCDYGKHTLLAWVYDESSPLSKLTFEFLDSSSTVQFSFKFGLGYKGWRQAIRSYRYDMIGSCSPPPVQSFDSIHIRAPSSGQGTICLDSIEW